MTIRPADCRVEREELIRVLQSYLPYLPHDRYFDWLYNANPDGAARAWLAVEPGTKSILGVAAAFPRRISHCGREKRAYVLGDFGIHPEHRSLGVAVALQRACLESLSPEDTFAIDFPSNAMLAVYKRLHMEPNRQLRRYAKPLRVDRKVAARLPAGSVARSASTVGNMVLRLLETGSGRHRHCTIEVAAGPCGQEFTEAAGQWCSRFGTSVMRTAEFLNWRYYRHPERQYRMLTAHQSGKLQGFLVSRSTGEDCIIDDLAGADDAVCGALLAEASSAARRDGANTISALWLTSHPGTALLERCGFRPRESSPVVLFRLSPGSPRPVPEDGDWYLGGGDPER